MGGLLLLLLFGLFALLLFVSVVSLFFGLVLLVCFVSLFWFVRVVCCCVVICVCV